MLKTELKTFLLVLLLMEVEVNYTALVSYVLPVMAGLSFYTGAELKNGTLSWRRFMIKILNVFGLCIAIYYIYKAFNPGLDISLALILITTLSDAIVTHFIRAGKVGVKIYFANLFNVNKTDGNDK